MAVISVKAVAFKKDRVPFLMMTISDSDALLAENYFKSYIDTSNCHHGNSNYSSLKQCQQENGHLNLTNYSHAEMTIEALLVPCCCHMMVLHSGMQLNLIKSLIFMAVLFFLFSTF